MRKLRLLRRAWHINRVLVKHGLEDFLAPTPLAWLRPILRLLSFRSSRAKGLPRGARLREALTELGPIYIKLGQMLSTRRDLIPPDIADELALLQDKVPPFDSAAARGRIERHLGATIDKLFAEFNDRPLASASVAQVHTARLHSGEQVVVKVTRPGIRKTIDRDLVLLHALAEWAETYSSEARRLRARAVVTEYERTILNELDLRVEAANTSQLRRNFENSPLLYVPQIFWDYTTEKVLVEERISGIPIADIDALSRAGVDMKVLAERGVEIFFTQVFRHSFFHADMHPGNIFINASDPSCPSYIAIDCGIMGTLSEVDKRYLAENFLAFFERDYHHIAQLHVDSGWVPAGTPVAAFESAIRTACEPIFGRPLADISFGHFLVQLFQTARAFNMEVQPQLVLLQKTLLYVEGLGRQLYPQLDLWQTAQPFLRRWMADQMSPKAVWDELKRRLPGWAERLPEMPDRLYHFLNVAEERKKEQLSLRLQVYNLTQSLQLASQRLTLGCIGIGLLLTTAWLTNTEYVGSLWHWASGIGAGFAFLAAVTRGKLPDFR